MVYRVPFRTAQHYVARVEWQPLPSWEFDGVTALVEYITGAGSFGGDTTLYGIADSVAYASGAGTISIPKIVEGVTQTVAYTLNTGTVDSEFYTSAVSHMIARAPRSAISARAAKYKMNARLN